MDLEYASELFSYVDGEIALHRDEVENSIDFITNRTETMCEHLYPLSRDEIREIVIEVLMEKGIITPEDFSRLDSSKIGELYNF